MNLPLVEPEFGGAQHPITRCNEDTVDSKWCRCSLKCSPWALSEK